MLVLIVTLLILVAFWLIYSKIETWYNERFNKKLLAELDIYDTNDLKLIEK